VDRAVKSPEVHKDLPVSSAISSSFGVVLSKEKLGEIDLLVELLTPEGKVWVIAKGAQKSKRRFVNALEEFNLLKVYLRKPKKGELQILEKVEVLFIPERVRYDTFRYLLASYFLEVLSKTSFPELKAEHFEFVKWLSNYLETPNFSLLIKPLFELRLCNFLGWKPELETCLSCGYRPKKVFFFSFKAGGILCPKCRGDQDEFLNDATVDIFKFLIKMPLKDAEALMFDLEESLKRNELVAEKVFSIPEVFLLYHLEFDVTSLGFLKSFLLTNFKRRQTD